MLKVASVEGIDEYRLSNGLRILLFPDPSKQTTTVNITYLVGSRCENYGETGMAHLLEHMMFKGSKGHPNVPNELSSHGARPNGSTWLDRTNYFETFAATGENLAWALDLEADRMVNSFIAKKDLQSEMTVVRNEHEVGENHPRSVMQDRLMETAYLWHNYGHPTIGARSDIELVPIERLQAFYRTWYQPDNAVLVVAGKCDASRALALIQEKFGAIPKSERALPVTYTVEPPQDGERSVTLRRVGETQAIGVGYHIPAGSHPDHPVLEILASILGDAPSGRLYKALVEARQATSVSAWAMQIRDPGMLILTSELTRDQPAGEVEDQMIRIAESAGIAPPTPEEVDRAKASLLKDWELTMRDSQRAAIGLSEWAALGDWRMIFLHRDHLQAVKAEDVQRVAAAYLRRDNRTVGRFIPTTAPERVEIPPTPDVASLVSGYAGGAGMAKGEEFSVTPENIEAHVMRSSLPGGLKLAVLSKKTRGSSANFAIDLHFGDEQSLWGRAAAGDAAADMLMRGTRRHTRQQISDELDRLKARIRIFGGAQGVILGGECDTADLPDVLKLAAEILRSPSFPDSEFELLRQEHLAALEESKSDPRHLSSSLVQRHLYSYPPEDARYLPTPEEGIGRAKALKLQDVVRFHRDFYGASSGEVAVVGDFPPDSTATLIASLFGDWKSPKPFHRIDEHFVDVAPINQLVETADKESASFRAGLRVNLRDDDPDYPALVLANYMTGGGFLNSRLAVRIRQKEGLSYSVGSFFFAGRWDSSAAFGSFAIYAPQNNARFVTAFQEEIARVVDQGFTAGEMAAAKSGWLQQRQVSRSQDRNVARQLVEHAFNERTFDWDARVEQAVQDLTPGQILAAVKRHIDPSRISIARAGDFAGAAKKAPPAETQEPPRAGSENKGQVEGTDPA